VKTILQSLTEFLDQIPGERRTPENCQIRNWSVVNATALDGLSGAALIARETALLKELFVLPDWHPLAHCFHAIEMCRDYDEPRKTIHQMHALNFMRTSKANGRDHVINNMLLKENTHPGMLSPKVALAAHRIVCARANDHRLTGLTGSLFKAYRVSAGE